MSANGTVAQTYLVELDARSVQLEAELAKTNKRLADTEKKLESLQAAGKKTGESADAMGVKFGTAADKITFTAGAIGAVLLGIGVKATQMAAAVDGSIKQIGAAAPALRTSLSAVKEDVVQVAEAAGRSRDEIRGAAEQIARLGVESEAEFKAKLNAATLIADATGTQLTTAVDGVDQLGDAFNLTADKIVGGVARVFSAAKGRVDFDSIFGALIAATPRIQQLGLDFDTSVRATVALLDRGLSAKKVGGFFNDHDADGIRTVAREAKIASGALQELEEAAAFRRSGKDRDITRAVNELKGSLEDLGERILPTVTKNMSNLVTVMDLLTGKFDELRAKGGEFTATAITLSQNARVIKPGSTQHIRLDDALSNLQTGVRKGGVDLGALPAAQLTQLRDALQINKDLDVQLFENTHRTKLNADQVRDFGGQYVLLAKAIDDALAKQKALNTETASGGSGSGGAGARGRLPLSEQQKAKIRSFKEETDSAIAAATPEKADNLAIEIAKIREKAKDLVKEGLIDDAYVNQQIERLKNATAAAAKVQLQAFQDELNVQLTSLGNSQADVLAANVKKVVDEARKKISAIPLVTDDNRQQAAAATAAVDAYEQRSQAAIGVLRLTEQQQRADKEAAAALAEYDHQTDLLTERETQLKAVIENGDVPRQQRNKAEQDLVAVRQQQLALSEREEYAVRAEIARIRAEVDAAKALQTELAKKDPNSKAVEELKDRITAYIKQIDDLELKLQKLGGVQVKLAADANKEHNKTLDFLKAHAKTIEECVQGAIALADAFGLVDQKTARSLQNVANIAASLPGALSGDPSSIFNIVGNVAELAKSVFGANAEQERAYKQALEANTAVLRELARQGGLLGRLSLSGGDVDAALKAASLITGRFSKTDIDYARAGGLDTKANTKGLTPDEWDAITKAAKAAGIQLDGTGQSFYDLMIYLARARQQLAEFGTDAASVFQQLDAERSIFGDKGPAANLDRLSKTLGTLSPAIASVFAGLDPSKADDLEKIRQRVEALFKTMEAGGEVLSASALGGLSGDDFLKTLEQIIAYLNALQPATASLSDQFGLLQQEFQLFDITDPIEQLRQLAAAAAASSPQLKGLVDDLDLSTKAGRQTAQERLQALFEKLKGDPANKDLLDVLVQFKALLDAANQQANQKTAGSGGYNVSREITEATGGRIAGLLTSANVFASRTADAVEALLKSVTGLAPLPVPTFVSSRSSAGGGSVTINLTVNVAVSGGASVEQGQKVGAAAGYAAYKEIKRIDAALGRELRIKRLIAGDVLLNPSGSR
jgi:hypothetical protein